LKRRLIEVVILAQGSPVTLDTVRGRILRIQKAFFRLSRLAGPQRPDSVVCGQATNKAFCNMRCQITPK
jgi:hypothetical protein